MARSRTSRPAPRGLPEQGFSLVELLVVITIIGILATMVTVKVIQYVGQARIVKAKGEISQIRDAIGIYRIKNNGRLPESLQDLAQVPKGEEEPIMEVPRDPWGNEYVYEKTGTRKFVVRSYGADGNQGGEGEEGDIDSDHLADTGEGTGDTGGR